MKQDELLNMFTEFNLLEKYCNEDEYRRNYRKYFKECLKIRDKDSNIVVFVPNKHQEQIIDIIEDWKREYPDEKKRPTLFIIILKARQIGFSTCVEGIFFHELHFNKNKIAIVISYDESSAQNINDISDRFYQHLPKDMKPMKRPSRGKGILFENPTNDHTEFEKNPGLQSKFLIDTAGNRNAGSSFTINYLHISELAKYGDHAKETLTSLLQAVPQYGGIVIIESTAKGLELFHQLWQQTKRKELNYKPIFVGWTEHFEYTKPFVDKEERQHFKLDEKEEKLKETYNLTYEQLNWRRDMIKTKCHGDENDFSQEYPTNDVECFLTSGRPVFNRINIDARIKYLQEQCEKRPPDKGYIELNEKTGKYEFVPDENGTIFIYEHPKKNYPYVIGGDVAEGLKSGDWSVSSVGDNTNGKQVAVQRLHCEPDIFAIEQIKLARYYNEALIADEVNNHGLVTIKELQNTWGYFNQYKRERVDSIHTDKEQRFGFRTDSATRPRLIDKLRSIARDNINLINDLITLDEMMTFIYADSGKEEAERNCFDDTVIAIALMYEARGQQRAYALSTPETWSDDVHPSVKADLVKSEKLKEYYERRSKIKRTPLFKK